MSNNKKIHVRVAQEDSARKKTYLHLPEDHDHRRDRVLLASGITFLIIVIAWAALLRWNFSHIDKDATELDIGESLSDIQESIQGASDDFSKELEDLEQYLNGVEDAKGETAAPDATDANSDTLFNNTNEEREDNIQHLP